MAPTNPVAGVFSYCPVGDCRTSSWCFAESSGNWRRRDPRATSGAMMIDVGPAHPLGIRDERARTFWTALIIAAAAHLPFTPLPFVLHLLALYLTRGDTSWDYQDDRVII